MIGKESTDEQLMRDISKGNRMAFELLYDRYFDRLVWFARRFIEDVQAAEDAVQEVFIKIMESPEKFDEQRKFSTWAYTVTGNSCKNILRNEQNRARILQENISWPESELMTHSIDYKLLKQRIAASFKELNEKEKQIYVLRFEHELAIKEIAKIMTIPEGSVKSGIYYLLKKVAQQLKDFDYER